MIITEKILLQVCFYRFIFKFQPLCDFNFSRSSNIPPNFKPFSSKYEWKTHHFFILILQKLSCQKWTFILVMMLIKYLQHCSSSFVTSCWLKRLSRPTFKKNLQHLIFAIICYKSKNKKLGIIFWIYVGIYVGTWSHLPQSPYARF